MLRIPPEQLDRIELAMKTVAGTSTHVSQQVVAGTLSRSVAATDG